MLMLPEGTQTGDGRYADIAKDRIAELRELLRNAEGPPMFRP
jgi:hypothetical protein